jgi:hypothetical protein
MDILRLAVRIKEDIEERLKLASINTGAEGR